VLIDHLLAQPVPGAGVDLVEVRFLRLRGCREQLNRAGHQRETQIDFQ
jgi:hypothetical protein